MHLTRGKGDRNRVERLRITQKLNYSTVLYSTYLLSRSPHHHESSLISQLMAVHITLAAAFMVGCNSVLPESQWPIREMISQAIAVAMLQ
jgi:hypothetical protein